LRDLGWALLVGVVFGLSPHSSGGRLAVSVAGGVAVGTITLGYRVIARRRRPDARVEAPPRALATLSIQSWAVLLATAAVFAPTLAWLFDAWTTGIWRNGHGLFVAVLMVFLTQRTLRRDPVEEAESSPWGFAFVLAALSLIVLDSGIRTRYLSGLGLALFLPGLSLLLLGNRRTRALGLPLFLGFLAIPLPNIWANTFMLPDMVAAGTGEVLDWFGVPIHRVGTTFMLPEGEFGLSDNCSGWSAFHASMGAGLVFAYYSRSRARKVALVLAPWVLTVLGNIVRSVVLLGLGEIFGLWIIHTAIHGLSGIVTFWGVLGFLFLMADRERLREALA
jgi:exosortase